MKSKKKQQKKRGRRPGPRGIKWHEVADLGVAKDREIAERLDVTLSAVTQARQRMGIRSLRGAGRPPKKAKATRPGLVNAKAVRAIYEAKP
jgi:Mn-dependent DtxR family transcriptional regulator